MLTDNIAEQVLGDFINGVKLGKFGKAFRMIDIDLLTGVNSKISLNEYRIVNGYSLCMYDIEGNEIVFYAKSDLEDIEVCVTIKNEKEEKEQHAIYRHSSENVYLSGTKVISVPIMWDRLVNFIRLKDETLRELNLGIGEREVN